jgi:hypothetical protein
MESRTTSFGKATPRGASAWWGTPLKPPQVSMRLISHRPLLSGFVVVAGDVARAKQDPGE